MLRVIIYLTIICLSLPALVLSQQAVEVNQIQNGDFVEVRAKNPNPFQVTAEIRLTSENLELTGSRQVTILLNPYNNRMVKRLRILDRHTSWKVESEIRTAAGNVFVPIDEEYHYQLPFGNSGKYRLEQGYDDFRTHHGSGRFALDFSMPGGTPVHAAREGVVAGLREDSNRSGLHPTYESEGNFVMILHEDGTLAVYAHLQKGGVKVEMGQPVEQGELIGYSGNTGYSVAPHLHFMVGRFDLNGAFTTLPVKFKTNQGKLTELKTGEVYSRQ